MAKGLVSYPVEKREEVASRRVAGNTGGLGYLSAVEAQREALRKELIAKGLIKPLSK